MLTNLKCGELIYGEVKKQTKDGFIIDLGDNAEAYLAREEMIPKRNFTPETTCKCDSVLM